MQSLSYTMDLFPVLVCLTFLVIVVLWNVIANFKSTNWLWVFLLVPLTLGSAVTIYQTVSNLLGYAVWLQIQKIVCINGMQKVLTISYYCCGISTNRIEN